MSHWLTEILLFVFAAHLPLFAWQYRRTREIRFAAATLTFALLVIAHALRVFAPALAWRGRPLHEPLRVMAWLVAAISIALLLRHCIGGVASRR